MLRECNKKMALINKLKNKQASVWDKLKLNSTDCFKWPLILLIL